ncbi:MAG: aminopeptidase P family protein [Pseudomonadota bacterium]|nr:aminopeptidase P family protein [Pseudomonadota bacterium]
MTTANDAAPDTSAKTEAPASHDTTPPPALLDFMLQGWAPRGKEGWEPVKHAAAHKARRDALAYRFPGERLVIPTGHEQVRANDTHFRFRPGSDFFWLTGCHEADNVLVVEPQADGGHQTVLFCEPNNRDSAAFFTDRKKGELWVGARLGLEGSKARFGVDECRPLAELPALLGPQAGTSTAPTRVLRGFAPAVDAAVSAGEGDAELTTWLSEARLIKDPTEVEELRVSIDATKRGFEDVILALRTAPTERWVEGVFGLRARVEGNDVGYGTIAACGSHACVLHWTRNDGALPPGELLLLDAGVEGHSLYTADITRTLPVSGTYTPPQRRIYELVWRAQRAALAAVRPGADFLEPNRAAMKVLTEGLYALGILKASPEEALREDRQLYKRWTLHNVSHMLGIDVHDCAKARQESYKFGKLEAGMVLTIEPGLYFQPDDLTVDEEYRGIGIRIEDDVVVTADGCENLSAHIPTEADEVEAWIARIWAAPTAQ